MNLKRTSWNCSDLQYLNSVADDIYNKVITFEEVAKKLERNVDTVKSAYYNHSYSSEVNQYALYKGDELLAIGTIKEIAELLDIKKTTVRYYGTPTHRKRVGENGRRLIRL